MRLFWEHSVGCAAGHCQGTGLVNPETAFVAGLLHDIGRIIAFKQAPAHMAAAMRRAEAEGCPLFVAERQVLGFDHAALGGHLLQKWQFPANLEKMVRYHHDLDEPFIVDEPAVVHLADVVATAMGWGGSGNRRIPAADPAPGPPLGLTGESLAGLVPDMEERLAATMRSFSRTTRGRREAAPNLAGGLMAARILVIDDDAAFREMLCEALASKDFEPVGVGTAEEGVARAKAEAFDLVLTDVMLPGMDGIEGLSKIGRPPRTARSSSCPAIRPGKRPWTPCAWAPTTFSPSPFPWPKWKWSSAAPWSGARCSPNCAGSNPPWPPGAGRPSSASPRPCAVVDMVRRVAPLDSTVARHRRVEAAARKSWPTPSRP